MDVDGLPLVARLPRIPDLDKRVRLARPGHRAKRASPQLLQQMGPTRAAENADESTTCLDGSLDLGWLGRTLDLGVPHMLGLVGDLADHACRYRRGLGVLDEHRNVYCVRNGFEVGPRFRG